MMEQEDHLTICTICKDDTASKAGLTESYLSDTHFAFLQPSDFVTLPTGEVKRRRQKGSYKDIYLERKGYVDVVVRGKLTNTEKERAFVTNPLTQSLNCDDINLLKISSASNTNNNNNNLKIGTHYIRDPSFKGHIHDNNIKIITNYKEESSLEKEMNEHNDNIEEEKEHFNHSHTVNLESENDKIYVINKTLVPTTDLGQFITKGNSINKRYISLDAFKKDPKENNTVKRHNTPTQQQNDNNYSIQHNSNNSSIAKNTNNIIEHVDRKDKDKTARPKANIPKPKNILSQRHIVKSSSTGALHNKNKYMNNSNINDSKAQDISNRKLKNSKSSNNVLSNKNQSNSYTNKKQATIKSNQQVQHRNKENHTHKPNSQIQSQSQNNINNNEITTDIVNQQTELKKETFGFDNSLREQSLGDNTKITNKDENINQIEQFNANQCNNQNQKVFENNEDINSNQMKSSSNRNNRIKESKAKPKSKSCNNKDHDSTLKNNVNNNKENIIKLSSTSSKAASMSKIQKPKLNIDNKNNYINQQQQQSNICNNNKINELQQNEQNNNDNININNFIDNTISPIKATPINSHKISKENKDDFVNFEESINNKKNQDNLQNIASNNNNQTQKELLAKLHSLRSNNISNGIPVNQEINANNNTNNNNVSDNENNIQNLIINQQQDILNDNNNELFYESKKDLINQRLTYLKSKTENLRSSSIKKQQNNSLEMLEDLIKDKENSFNNDQNKQNIIHQDYKQNIDNLNSNNKPHFAESGLLKKLSLTPSSIPEIPNSGELHYMNSAQQLEDEIDKQNNNYIPFPKDIFNIKASKVKEANQININTNSIRDLLYYKGNSSHNTIVANYPNSLVNPKTNELVQRNERINDKLAETRKQILDNYTIESSSGVNKHLKKKSIEDIANTNSKWLGVNTNELLGIKDISTDPKSKELKNKFNQLKRDNEIKKKKTELNIQQNVLSSSTFSFKDSLMNNNNNINNINNINHIPKILHQSQSATNVYGTLDQEYPTKRKTYKDFDDLKYKTIIRNSHSLNHQEPNTDKQNNRFVDYQTFLANQKQNNILEEESNFHLNKLKNDLKEYNTNYKTKLSQNKIISKKENLINFSIPNGMHHSNSALNINYSYINNKLTKCYNNNNNNTNNVTNNIMLINGKGNIMPPNAIDKGVFQYFK